MCWLMLCCVCLSRFLVVLVGFVVVDVVGVVRGEVDRVRWGGRILPTLPPLAENFGNSHSGCGP